MKESEMDPTLDNQIVRASEIGLSQPNGTLCINIVVNKLIIIKDQSHNYIILTCWVPWPRCKNACKWWDVWKHDLQINNNCPLTAVLSVSNDSYSKFFLAYIGNILCCDVIYDLIKAEAHVQNCKTSDWSDFLYLVGHMITVCFDWLWLV